MPLAHSCPRNGWRYNISKRPSQCAFAAGIAQVGAPTTPAIASFALHRGGGKGTPCMIPKFGRAIFTSVRLPLYHCATEFKELPNLPLRNDPRDSDVNETACDGDNRKPNSS